ncbi:hypothetical protein LINGRAHAP2_LOCUS31098, partial [Linum grandiflorum]
MLLVIRHVLVLMQLDEKVFNVRPTNETISNLTQTPKLPGKKTCNTRISSRPNLVQT